MIRSAEISASRLIFEIKNAKISVVNKSSCLFLNDISGDILLWYTQSFEEKQRVRCHAVFFYILSGTLEYKHARKIRLKIVTEGNVMKS